MSRGNLRQANMIYDATSRQYHPYSQITPVHNTVPGLVLPPAKELLDQDCYSDCVQPPNQGLLNSLHFGSTASLTYVPTQIVQNTPSEHNFVKMESRQSDRSPTQNHWDPSATQALPSMSTSLTHSSPQSLSSISSREFNGGTGSRGKLKRSATSSSKRPSPEDFRNLILLPSDYEPLLFDYVGTDSKYTLAKNHAGMMVRSSVKSQDMAGKMREVADPLDAIDLFLGFLLDHEVLRPEQKGCVSLRICFGALTALLGDFSQGSSVENSPSDPHAAVVPMQHLAEFRILNPELRGILCRLSARLEKSMNLYRHRRSPSASLVAKFQEMSDTLVVWNHHLMDSTFESPSRIASEWLRNHPNQVEGRRRNREFSEQGSPNLSDTTRISPSQRDSNYLSPITAYGEPSRSPNRSNTRSISADGNQYDSLFRSSTGVTYYGTGPTNMTSSSIPLNPNVYRTTSFESLNLPPLTTDEFGMFAHQSHPSNTDQYHGGGPSYPDY